MTPRRSAAAMLLAAGLGGCAAGPDFHPPLPPAEERYTVEPLEHVALGARIEADWWTLFRSDALTGLVRQAIEGNRSLAAAAATLAQARELAAAQAGALLPQVGLTAGAGRQKYGNEFLGTLPKPPPFTYFALGPTVSYTLDYAGGGGRAVERQAALAEYQRQQLAAAYLTVTGSVALQSIAIASARAQVAAVEEILEQDRSNLKLVQASFDAGAVSRVDIVAARSQLANDATLLPPLRQELSVARHALAILLGRPPGTWAPPDLELAEFVLPRELPASLPSELAHRRPDILAAEAQLHAATAAVGIAQANRYPHITLAGNAGPQALTLGGLFSGGNLAWGLTASLVAPLFDGGTLRAEQRAAVQAMRASAANYEQTVLTAFGQVADLLEALDHDAEQLEAQSRAQDAAEENLRLTRESYKEGNVNVLQVLDAERLHQQARLGFVRAQARRCRDTVQLFLALGGSTPGGASPATDTAPSSPPADGSGRPGSR
jgi:NodT family efflux transporter outer membrane factor (OMF) lipoprotein